MNDNAVMLRNLEVKDIASVAEFVAATPLWQRYGVTANSFANRLTSGLNSGARIIIAERDSEILGFVWVAEKGAFARDLYIPLIGVHPTKRSHGVGALLLQHVENKMFDSPRDVFLLVSDFNEGAKHFYQKNGYAEVGRLPNYVLEGVSELIYWKKAKL